MQKITTISLNKDFRRIYARGKSYITPCLVIYCQKNRFGTTRIGITASKKTGNAVKRNRSRRIIREAYRIIMPSVVQGWDIVFVARASTSFKKSTDILPIMKKQLKNAGVLI